jgi:hypothetical protein
LFNPHCCRTSTARPSIVAELLLLDPALLQNFYCSTQHCCRTSTARPSIVAELPLPDPALSDFKRYYRYKILKPVTLFTSTLSTMTCMALGISCMVFVLSVGFQVLFMYLYFYERNLMIEATCYIQYREGGNFPCTYHVYTSLCTITQTIVGNDENHCQACNPYCIGNNTISCYYDIDNYCYISLYSDHVGLIIATLCFTATMLTSSVVFLVIIVKRRLSKYVALNDEYKNRESADSIQM